MRENFFRGKTINTNSFVYGYYAYCTDGKKLSNRIYSSYSESYGKEILHPTWFEVAPETVGQFTGLKDNNGINIFEGDIVYLGGKGNVEMKYPFEDLYDSVKEQDIGSIVGNIYE